MKHHFKTLFILLILSVIYHSSVGQTYLLDNTFGTNGKVVTNFSANDLNLNALVQSDGKIILTGSNYPLNSGYYNFLIARYTIDGALDTSFSGDGFDTLDINGGVSGSGIQSDGKILITGSTYQQGTLYATTTRYNPNGQLDSSFGINGILNTSLPGNLIQVNAITITPNGNILVAGATGTFNDYNGFLIQYKSDGSLDSSFGINGILINSLPSQEAFIRVIIQPDGKILCGGQSCPNSPPGYYPGQIMLWRFNQDGTPDSTFNGDGMLVDSVAGYSAVSMALYNDGKIIIGCQVRNSVEDIGLARYNSDGSPDSTFGINSRAIINLGIYNTNLRSLILQPDGKILAAIYSSAMGSGFSITRLNTDGSIDQTFGINGFVTNFGGNNNIPQCIFFQPSGKILISGSSKFSSTDLDFTIMRYNIYAFTAMDEIQPKTDNYLITPHPVTGQSILTFMNPANDIFNFYLYDLTGRLVENRSTAESRLMINKESTPSGLYIFHLINKKTGLKIAGKLLVE